jgi:hypothetical protein
VVGNSVAASFEKYLGLLALVGRSKKMTFAGIQGRVCKKLKGWKEKFLSQAGREVLLKVVVQAIPTYSMSIFRLPKTLCNNLGAIWQPNRKFSIPISFLSKKSNKKHFNFFTPHQ